VCAEAGAHDDIEDERFRIILNVWNLDRRALLYSLANRCLADANMTIPDLGDDLIVPSIRRAQPEFLT